MLPKFFVKQKLLGISECQQLCVRSSREIEDLAGRCGWRGISGEPVRVPAATAINMLILSIAMIEGVEPSAMATSLPGLRNESLLKLGEATSNWCFDGTQEAEHQFWPLLYGTSDLVRLRIAPLLGCSVSDTTRQIRFLSSNDVERLSPGQFEQGNSGRIPRFTIDAHNLAEKMEQICSGPIFTATLASKL